MTNIEFKNYCRHYCKDTGVPMPLYETRLKLCHEFSKIKYSDKTDLECALWEFLDDNLMKKPSINGKKTDFVIFDDVIDRKDSLTLQDFAKAKAALEKANCPMTSFSLCSINAPCQTAVAFTPWPAPCNSNKACKKEEKEDTMTYNEIEASRKYLNTRLCEARYVKRDELIIQFNIQKPSQPTSYKQLIDAIKNDQYTLDPKRTACVDAYIEDHGTYHAPFEGIKWTFPGLPDRDGFRTAEDAMEKAYTAAKDITNTGDAAAGLKALQDFEAWTPTVATTTAQ